MAAGDGWDGGIEALAVVDDGETKGAFDRQLKRVKVDPETVRDSLQNLRQMLPDDSTPADGTVQRWRMDEVTLSLEVSADGSLLVAGLGAKASIQVTFKRQG